MAETEQTKICPLCAETIKEAAKICPHCRKSQRRWLYCSENDLLAIATILIFIGAVILTFKVFTGSRNFSSSRDKIEVLNSQLAVDVSSESTNVVVSGILTNRSDYAWQMIEFEVRYLNDSGKLVDVDSGSEGFTVLPHSDHSFHLTLYSRKSIPEHASHKVIIRSASDPGTWFNND